MSILSQTYKTHPVSYRLQKLGNLHLEMDIRADIGLKCWTMD